MELFGLGFLLVLAIGMVLGIVIIFTRGIFNRDLAQALKRVTQQDQELQDKADVLEQRLRQMEQDYHAKLKRAETEAQRLTEEAKHQAMNIRTAAIEEAKHRARQLVLEVEQSKMQVRAELTKTLDGQAVQQACQALRTLLTDQMAATLHAQLMNELIEALAHLEAHSLHTGLERVEMRTARPLSPEQLQRLTQWVHASLGPHIALQVEDDETLVAGGLVRAGASVIDNSLVTRLKQTQQERTP